MSVVNPLVTVSKWVPPRVTAFGWRDFCHYFGCRLLWYLYRVAKGVSIVVQCGSWVSSRPLRLAICMLLGRRSSQSFQICELLIFLCMSVPNEQQNILKENLLWILLWMSEENYTFGVSRIVVIPWNHIVSPWSTPAVPWIPSSRGSSSRSSLFMRQHFLPIFTSVQSHPKYFCHCDTSFSLDSTSCLLYVDVAVVYIPCWQFLNTSALIPMCFPILSTFTVMCRDSTTCRFSSSWEEM